MHAADVVGPAIGVVVTLALQAVTNYLKAARAAMRAVERTEIRALEARVAQLEGRP